jgi:hypothetical protein
VRHSQGWLSVIPTHMVSSGNKLPGQLMHQQH